MITSCSMRRGKFAMFILSNAQLYKQRANIWLGNYSTRLTWIHSVTWEALGRHFSSTVILMFLLIELKLWFTLVDSVSAKKPAPTSYFSSYDGDVHTQRQENNKNGENVSKCVTGKISQIFFLLPLEARIKSENNKQHWNFTIFSIIFWLHSYRTFKLSLRPNLVSRSNKFKLKLLLIVKDFSQVFGVAVKRASRANVCVCCQAAVKCFCRGCVLCENFVLPCPSRV